MLSSAFQIDLYEEGKAQLAHQHMIDGEFITNDKHDSNTPSPLFYDILPEPDVVEDGNQSTSAVSTPTSTTSSSIATKVMSVSLSPGEVLYIPPYWLVHTQAPQLSLSIDVLSASQEQRLLLPAFHMALPFDNAAVQTPEQRIVSAQVYR